MTAVWQLWLLLGRRMPLLAILAQTLWLVGLGLMTLLPRDGTAAVGLLPVALGAWFWHIGQGQVLRGLCQPESALMPNFRPRLAALAAVGVAQWVLLPTALALACGVAHALLAGAGVLLAAALGVASGTGRAASLFIWVIFILVGWQPALAARIARIALNAPLVPLLLVLVAALIVFLVTRPLLRIDDRPPDSSPLANMGIGQLDANTADGTPNRRGALGKRLAGIFDAASQRALDRALIRFGRHPTRARRLALVRSLLLPYDNPIAIALRLLLVAAVVSVYFLVTQRRHHLEAAVIGAYAILLTLARFPQLGRGMQRMRPNLADLYLTLAPTTRVQYQKTLSDALLVLVPISVLTALGYTMLGIVLIHAAEPAQMLLTAAIVSATGSLIALAIHMIGPENSFGRSAINAVLIAGAMGAYWGGYALIGWAGLTVGGLLLGVVTLGFGLSVWFAAQREYLRRQPLFDLPV